MKIRVFGFLMVLCGPVWFTFAQQPASAGGKPALVIPDGPLLAKAGDFSSWTITFSYPVDRVSPDIQKANPLPEYMLRLPRKETVVKTKNIISESFIDLGGRPGANWYVGSSQYTKSTGPIPWLQFNPNLSGSGGSDSRYAPLPPSGFRDTSWISASSYIGTIKRWGRDCLVFIPDGPSKIDLSSGGDHTQELDALNQIAYVDAQSRLPLYLNIKGEIRIFNFLPDPVGMQTLPPDLADAIAKGEKGRRDLLAAPLPP